MECGYPGGCDRPPQKKFTRGMCHYHYKKAMAEGYISHITTPTPTLCERFEGKVDKQGGLPRLFRPLHEGYEEHGGVLAMDRCGDLCGIRKVQGGWENASSHPNVSGYIQELDP